MFLDDRPAAITNCGASLIDRTKSWEYVFSDEKICLFVRVRAFDWTCHYEDLANCGSI